MASFQNGLKLGIILGPISFIICINDLPDMCKQFANVYLFADDAKLYRHIVTKITTISSLVYVPYKNGQINGFVS